ncbi:mechanosensitive ion channel family protein [Patescibacteria group bacterium]|nr:mechanosensitive ion channel family protein [Patescibacteria group bacterium]MBU4347133.1 mechanosensitive ion channel family protein [Patescibacteria group bacterium]MBU4455549.1 mechanosensitive ion channel family protein [Patescibacteria group bacterium]
MLNQLINNYSFLKIEFLGNAILSWIIAFAVFLLIIAAQKFIDYGAEKIIKKREKGEGDNAEIIKLLSVIAKILLWVVAVLFILSNLGYNVTSLIAGLGIGGIAAALALQNILGDIFSSFSIYFDKPFKPGDFIVVSGHTGVVKKIGIKSTRIQTLQGEELIMSNSELTKASVQNFGLMRRRRIVFNVGVIYDTPAEKLKRIPDMIRKIIEAQAETEVDRVHFKSFGDSSLMYEIVYYVESGEYNRYMDIQQAINLAIVDKFEEEKIVIAYPTQTVYVKKEG